MRCWLAGYCCRAGNAWGQQSKREYIYLDGKLVSVETGSVTPLCRKYHIADIESHLQHKRQSHHAERQPVE